MTERFDIIVVGAGLIGAAFALDVTAKTSLRVALVERGAPLPINNNSEGNASSTSSNQRVVALGNPAIELLKSIGVFQGLSSLQAHPYDSMLVWDEGSPGKLSFNASEIGQTELGFMVDAIACTQALQHAALTISEGKSSEVKSSEGKSSKGHLTCFFNTQVEQLSFDSNGATLQCQDGSLSATLIVGADGGQSWVRSQAKIFANRRNYNQHGIVAKIKTVENHNNCAWQRFLKSGPVAALPVNENYSSIVWSADTAFAKELMSFSDDDFCTALAQVFDGQLGDVVEIGHRLSFPLISQKAESYYAPSLALIGDAAHSIHPLAGQGANLGFKDAACLSDLLLNTSPKNIGDVACLAKYEQRRRPDNEQTDWLMTALNSSYQENFPLWLSVRGAGMNWLNNSSRLKALLAQQAMGI